MSAGPVVAGHVGAETRFEYTVVGDPVNAAARLTELAKGVPGRVLADLDVVERAGTDESSCWEAGDVVVLRGRSTPTRLAVVRRARTVPGTLVPGPSRTARRGRSCSCSSRWSAG